MYPSRIKRWGVPFSVLFGLLGCFYNGISTPYAFASPEKSLMTKILSIRPKDGNDWNILVILGNGRVPSHEIKLLESPPRIVLDIPASTKTFDSKSIQVNSPLLKRIRLGYHAQSIRVVFDIEGPIIPAHSVKQSENTLIIALGEGKPHKSGEEAVRDPTLPLEASQKSKGLNKQVQKEEKSFTASIPLMGEEKATFTQIKKGRIDDRDAAWEKLLQVTKDDSRAEASFFTQAIEAYKTQDWTKTIELLQRFIDGYPGGMDVEKASFLLARAYDRQHSPSHPGSYSKIKEHYEGVVNHFQTSPHVVVALLAMGDLAYKAKEYDEALGFYNMILENHGNSDLGPRALLQKVKILSIKKKERKEALEILDRLIREHPGTSLEIEGKLELAKLLYETGSYKKSLTLLTELENGDQENRFRFPELALYQGYTCHQLGERDQAKKYFFMFYNSTLGHEQDHLILTKIADIYREQGLNTEALKLYQLVLERHPDTEGALISLIRLAEEQEKAGAQKEKKIVSPFRAGSKQVGLPKEIYENVVHSLLTKDPYNPLVQVALLKLSLLYQQEKEYDKSLALLKDLHSRYPSSKLRDEIKQALIRNFEGLFAKEIQAKNYTKVAEVYHTEESLLTQLGSPHLFLLAGRAFLQLDLEEEAARLFNKSNALFNPKERPPDLLYFLGKKLFEEGKTEQALGLLQEVISRYPSDKYASTAQFLLGKVFFKTKRYAEAAEAFEVSLNRETNRCDKAVFLVDQVKAFMACNLRKEALKSAKEADKLIAGCSDSHRGIQREIGGLYLDMGYPQEALSVLIKTLESAEEEEKAGMKIMIARCYELLHKKEDYLPLYKEISSINDPFWSSVAKERLAALEFDDQIRASEGTRKTDTSEGERRHESIAGGK